MGRGRSGGSGGGTGKKWLTDAQEKTLAKITKQTRDLKNEQHRIIDENGNVVVKKQGTKGEVYTSIGEMREHGKGAVDIHNHPDGGTFSEPDLRAFGYGMRAIQVASPEGTYRLTNVEYGTKKQYEGWYGLQQALSASGVTRERSFTEIRNEAKSKPAVVRWANAVSRTSDAWVRAKQAGKPQATLDRLYAQYERQSAKYKAALAEAERQVVVEPYHKFYRQNASKYGFKYEFIRR